MLQKTVANIYAQLSLKNRKKAQKRQKNGISAAPRRYWLHGTFDSANHHSVDLRQHLSRKVHFQPNSGAGSRARCLKLTPYIGDGNKCKNNIVAIKGDNGLKLTPYIGDGNFTRE